MAISISPFFQGSCEHQIQLTAPLILGFLLTSPVSVPLSGMANGAYWGKWRFRKGVARLGTQGKPCFGEMWIKAERLSDLEVLHHDEAGAFGEAP